MADRVMTPAEIALDDRLFSAWSYLDVTVEVGAGRALGVKDVIDVQGMPTACGLASWRDRTAATDAEIVRRLRAAGWIPIGKTQTAQFAFADPPPTVSPFDPAVTPGGSSTGSAVAVARGHVDLAVGTQTGGSIVRPAAYAGVVGFKPTQGSIPLDGAVPLVPSIDTLGFLADRVATAASAYSACTEPQTQLDTPPAGELCVLEAGPFLSDEATAVATARAMQALRAAWPDPVPSVATELDLQAFRTVFQRVLAAEAWETQEQLLLTEQRHLAPKLHTLLVTGRGVTVHQRQHDTEELDHWRDRLLELVPAEGVLVLPAAPAQPPPRSDTGSSLLAAPWTVAGTPVVAVPFRTADPDAIGALQIVGRPHRDADVLWYAARVEEVLHGAGLAVPGR